MACRSSRYCLLVSTSNLNFPIDDDPSLLEIVLQMEFHKIGKFVLVFGPKFPVSLFIPQECNRWCFALQLRIESFQRFKDNLQQLLAILDVAPLLLLGESDQIFNPVEASRSSAVPFRGLAANAT